MGNPGLLDGFGGSFLLWKRFIIGIHKPDFQLCMGTKMGVPGTPKYAVLLSDALPPSGTWSIFGVGPSQFPMVAMGVLLNGHVRIGFEDNLYLSKGVLAKSNAELIKRTVTIIRSLNKEVATVEDTKKILSLSK